MTQYHPRPIDSKFK